MFGLVEKPCRIHQPEASDQWMSYMCGSCLRIGQETSHVMRAFLNTDAVFLAMLADAMSPVNAPTHQAGRCAFRGMRRADVVVAESTPANVGAFVSLMLAEAKVSDDLSDNDKFYVRLPFVARLVNVLTESMSKNEIADHFDLVGLRRLIEQEERATLAGDHTVAREAVSSAYGLVFRGVAGTAGRPDLAGPMATLGEALGRVATHLDAFEDRASDQSKGIPNQYAEMPLDEARRQLEDIIGHSEDAARTAIVELGLADHAVVPCVADATFRHARHVVSNGRRRFRLVHTRSHHGSSATRSYADKMKSPYQKVKASMLAPSLACGCGVGCDCCDCCDCCC